MALRRQFFYRWSMVIPICFSVSKHGFVCKFAVFELWTRLIRLSWGMGGTFQRSIAHIFDRLAIATNLPVMVQVGWLSGVGMARTHTLFLKRDSTLSRTFPLFQAARLPDHLFVFQHSGFMFPPKDFNTWGARWDIGTLQRAPASFTAAEGLGEGSLLIFSSFSQKIAIWGFPEMGVPQWLDGLQGEIPWKYGWWTGGTPMTQETPICVGSTRSHLSNNSVHTGVHYRDSGTAFHSSSHWTRARSWTSQSLPGHKAYNQWRGELLDMISWLSVWFILESEPLERLLDSM